MKLFLRDHLLLTIIYAIQMLLMVFVFWLDGYRHLEPILYAMFLSTCLFIFYLTYRFITLRSFYFRLSDPITEMNDALAEQSNQPLVIGLNELMASLYRLHQNDIRMYEKKLQDRITFINQWVHQMKTPLSVIHLTIQHEDDPVFDSIREEIDRLSAGLETALYSSRLDQFEQDFVVEPVHLDETISKIVTANKRLFIRNRVYPEVAVNKKWIVASDEKWLSFVLSQLITNAVRYSAGLGQKVTITVYLRGKHVVLEVADHGVGIPKEDQKRVFDAYFTGENGRQYRESTGMGLYLVHEVCKRLGHRVELESEVGVGANVRIIFHEMLQEDVNPA